MEPSVPSAAATSKAEAAVPAWWTEEAAQLESRLVAAFDAALEARLASCFAVLEQKVELLSRSQSLSRSASPWAGLGRSASNLDQATAARERTPSNGIVPGVPVSTPGGQHSQSTPGSAPQGLLRACSTASTQPSADPLSAESEHHSEPQQLWALVEHDKDVASIVGEVRKNITLAAAGNVDFDQLVSDAQRWCGQWTPQQTSAGHASNDRFRRCIHATAPAWERRVVLVRC